MSAEEAFHTLCFIMAGAALGLHAVRSRKR